MHLMMSKILFCPSISCTGRKNNSVTELVIAGLMV
ncbi:hypothetical protein Taro_018505 [Colocasia esculenta]|uniref:Uncharacterized protein n=1 Tax=Colocasia esculenta TaxID=4460 RepID=A0A843UWF1_COLES|nr:hypothetical protein [Colocasia esculenta]